MDAAAVLIGAEVDHAQGFEKNLVERLAVEVVVEEFTFSSEAKPVQDGIANFMLDGKTAAAAGGSTAAAPGVLRPQFNKPFELTSDTSQIGDIIVYLARVDKSQPRREPSHATKAIPGERFAYHRIKASEAMAHGCMRPVPSSRDSPRPPPPLPLVSPPPIPLARRCPLRFTALVHCGGSQTASRASG